MTFEMTEICLLTALSLDLFLVHLPLSLPLSLPLGFTTQQESQQPQQNHSANAPPLTTNASMFFADLNGDLSPWAEGRRLACP